MARMLFGGETAEIYLHEDVDGDLHAYGPLVAKCYDGFDDSASPVLDLLSLDEEGLDNLVVTGGDDAEASQIGQLPAFYGPDEVYELWVSVNDSPRQLLRAVNVGSNLISTKQSVDLLFNSGDVNPFDTALVDLPDVDGEQVEDAPEGSTLVKLSSGLYSSGSSPIPLSDILWVAASDAPANFQGAPYVCDGVDDQVEINAALSNSLGLKVGLSPGNFAVADPVRMHYQANPAAAALAPRSQYLIGSGQSVSKLNIKAGINAGIYIYDNVGAHIWDLTINVPDQRAIWAFGPGSAVDYRSMINGSIRRVTIAGPSAGTHANWGMSLKSADRVLLEDVTMTGTKWGMEIVSEETNQRFGNFVLRNCRVTIIGDNGQCYRTGNDAGELRQITFDTCMATVASTAQAGTEGWRISAASGQTYGVRLINCSSVGLATAIHTWPNVSDLEADFAVVEPRQAGLFAQAEGTDSKYMVSEFRVPSSVTVATLMTDTAPTGRINEYWHHTYTIGTSTISGTLGNSIIRRGIQEGLGTVPAALLRTQSNLIDRTSTKTVSVASGSIGTVASGFTVNTAIMRTSLDGKLVFGYLILKNTAGITVTPGSPNIADTLVYTINTAYRPTDSIFSFWGTAPSGSTQGTLIIGSAGTVTLTTANTTVAANSSIVITFIYVRD
jgi:hypothetical protein